jgi:rubrerythrin
MKTDMKYECSKCSYVMDKADAPKRCPYCGEEGTMQKAKSAQDILDEALSS